MSDTISRISLFIIFFWFGIIKVFSLSPAEDLIKSLYHLTLQSYNIMTIEQFLIALGTVECMIGIMWLFPKLTKITAVIFGIQMFTTFGPLVFLQDQTWQKIFVPTLVGQYIIKNVSLIALAFEIYSRKYHKK